MHSVLTDTMVGNSHILLNCSPANIASLGPFRRTCEITLGLLRQNEDALMTILETFLHDPTTDFIGKRVRLIYFKARESLHVNLFLYRYSVARMSMFPIHRLVSWKMFATNFGVSCLNSLFRCLWMDKWMS
jgi:hypothetical protein